MESIGTVVCSLSSKEGVALAIFRSFLGFLTVEQTVKKSGTEASSSGSAPVPLTSAFIQRVHQVAPQHCLVIGIIDYILWSSIGKTLNIEIFSNSPPEGGRTHPAPSVIDLRGLNGNLYRKILYTTTTRGLDEWNTATSESL